jgi:subtilase family serine protease
MVPTRRIAATLSLIALTACAGGSRFTPVAGGGGPLAAARPHVETTPGNGASALPGALLPCALSELTGQASCTIAINLRFPSLADPTQPASLIPGLQPSQLRSLYALPSGGAGVTVAIVDAYDDPTAQSDLLVYRAAFGLAPCTSLNGCFRKVNQSGGSIFYPLPNLDWAQETAMDLEMVSAACPNCKLLLVEANSASLDDLGASVDEAVALGAKIVSNSYYANEYAGETAEDAHFRHAGVAITVSAGDLAQPFYPAASPYVTSVGGTSLSGSPGAWSETPWAFGGRGCSAFEPRPKFQNATRACKSRSTVDVSAVADPNSGVAMFCTEAGGWVVGGGTSVGAPLIAAAYALGGPESPAFSYAHPAAFHDVPPAGYDLATGLGSPDGVAGL